MVPKCITLPTFRDANCKTDIGIVNKTLANCPKSPLVIRADSTSFALATNAEIHQNNDLDKTIKLTYENLVPAHMFGSKTKIEDVFNNTNLCIGPSWISTHHLKPGWLDRLCSGRHVCEVCKILTPI